MERITMDSDGAVSVLDHGGGGPLIVGVHGLEGSAYNWNLIAPELVRNHRMVAPDLSGFGYTAPLGRGSTVEANAKLVADVIKHFGDQAILIGNSMGGLISLLVAETYPDLVTGLVLIDPAAPVTNWLSIRPAAGARLSAPLIPGAGPRLVDLYRATRSAEEGVAEALAFVAKDANALDQLVWDNALEIAKLRRSQPWSTDALVEAARSIAPYVILRSRFATVLHRATQPTLLIHGAEDRLIQVESARWMARQRPDWTPAIFEGIGHVPMFEAPERLLAVIAAWEEAVFGPSEVG